MISNLTNFATNLVNSTANYLTISPDDLMKIVWKVGRIALEVFKFSLAFWVNPYFSLAALGVGLLFPDEIEPRLDRIGAVAENNKIYAVPLLFFCLLLKLPAPILGYSLYYGAKLGCSIIRSGSDNSGCARQTPAAGATG